MSCSDMIKSLKSRLKKPFQRSSQITKDQVEPRPDRDQRKQTPPEKIVSAESSTSPAPVQSNTATLWNEAYDAIRASDSKLVQGYEKILSQELKENTPSSLITDSQENVIVQEDASERQYQMRQMVYDGLQRNQRKMQVKQSIGEGLHIFNEVKDVISLAVKHVPEAALPWAGVCIGLQILSNPIAEAEANRKGIDYVIQRMDWYWSLSGRTLKDKAREDDSSAGLRGELRTRLIDLYKALLSYQMKSICSYYQKAGLASFRDLVKLNDWNGSLDGIKNAEAVFQQDWTLYRNEQKVSSLEGIDDNTRSIFQAIQEQSARNEKTLLEEGDKECLRDLRLIDPRDDLLKIEQRKDPLLVDSCQWVFDTEEFKEFTTWGSARRPNLLWIKGDAGKGKTMLLMGIIRRLSLGQFPKDGSSPCLSYFFCQGANSDLNSATAALRCIIWMLLEQQPWLISHLRRKYETAGPKLFTDENAFNALSEVSKAMLEDPRLGRVYLIIDALDECSDDIRPGLVELLGLISDTATSKVKWLVTSRNREIIKSKLTKREHYAILDLEHNSGAVSNAVATYIEHKLSDFSETAKYEDNVRDQLADKLRKKADGTFLWVALVCKILDSVRGNDAIDVLDCIPSGLEEVYHRMMEQINNLKWRYPVRCKQILSVVTLAHRPLGIPELAVLSDIQVEELQDIVIKCASFITVRDNIVYFIHQSAKEYLLFHSEGEIFPNGQSDVHGKLVTRSLQKMSSVLQRDIYKLRDPGLSIEHASFVTLESGPLASIRYACAYWVKHVCEIDMSLYSQIGLHDKGVVHRFLNKHFLHWLEALSLMRTVSSAVTALQGLETVLAGIENNQLDLLSMVRDAKRFILHSHVAVEEAPLQVYVSALFFSPMASKVRQLFNDQLPPWLSITPVKGKWNSCLQTLEGHTDAINAVAFSPDGQQLASASVDNTIRIWNTKTGTEQHAVKAHASQVNSVAFSHNGRFIASSSKDNIRLWDSEGSQIQEFVGHTDSVRSVAFSPDDQKLASGSWDGTVRLWDTETSEQLVLNGHEDRVSSIAFSSKWQLASASKDTTVRLWNLEAGTEQHILKHANMVFSVAFSPNGQFLASSSCDDSVRLWDVATGTQVRIFMGSTCPILSEGHEPSSAPTESTKSMDAHAQQKINIHTHTIESVAFSPDGRRLVSGGCDRAIRLWDVDTGASLQVFRGHPEAINTVAFSPDGRQFVSGSDDSTLRLWDIEAEAEQETVNGHCEPILSVALSPDEQQLATASDDYTLRLWGSETGLEQQTFREHYDSVRSVAFSPNGKWLASGSDDFTLCLWDLKAGTKTRKFFGHTDEINLVIFSSDSQWLASASFGHTIWVWDVNTGAKIHALEGHTNEIESLAWSPNSQYLASGSRDNTVCLWDTKSATQLYALHDHSGPVMSVTFSLDGQKLASVSEDCTVRLWDAKTGTALETISVEKNYAMSFIHDGSQLMNTLNACVREHSISFGAVTNDAQHWWSDRSWVVWNGRRVLWLPPEYRPNVSWVKDGCIGIGSESGYLFIVRFDHTKFPFLIE